LTGRAVEAVEWHVVGVDCATIRTEDGVRSTDVGGRGRELKVHAERHRVFDGGAEGVPTIKDPTWAAEPPAGALEAGALSPDGLGLLTVVVEEGDKEGRPTMLDGATCAPGSDGGAVLGGRGPVLDAIVAPILPRLGPIGGLGVNHGGVATADKECRRVEGRKGMARKAHRGFFKESHLNGGPLISGAAQEGRVVVFLEVLVTVVAREEASSLAGEAGRRTGVCPAR
jgi:hypothetical protein